jgi:hypothetical protein
MEFVFRQSSTTRSFSGGKADIVIYQNGQCLLFHSPVCFPGMGNVHSSNAFSLGFKVYHVLGDIFPIATKRQYARDRGIQRA